MQVPTEESDWEEEEEEEVSGSEDEQASQELVKSSDNSSEDEATESKQEASTRKAMMKRKRKQVESKAIVVKKPKSLLKKDGTGKKKPEEPIMDEKTHSEREEAAGKPTQPAGKKEIKMFNAKNVDLDLYNSPNDIVSRRIRLNANYILTCRTNNLTTQDGASIDYASIVFEKNGKGGRLNEFYIPLDLAPKCVEGFKELIKENAKYFNSYNP